MDIGSSYLMSDLLAAFLYGQLEQWEMVQSRRRRIWENYDAASRRLGRGARIVRRPIVPVCHCQQAYHMYYILTPSQAHIGRALDRSTSGPRES